MNRRTFLTTTGAAGAAIILPRPALAVPDNPLATATEFGWDLLERPVQRLILSEDEWRARLTDEEFAILREEKTERAFSSPLDNETRTGTFVCAGCGQPLYRSEVKFDSGTGWPSFTEAIKDAVDTKEDRSFFSLRTEVHCSRCDGHLGHIFEDGPEPTGNRHCINGLALRFVPDEA
ncbi:MAG: peptide-methionine (R)-S-oxide reductase MsrB [Shimia sp.]